MKSKKYSGKYRRPPKRRFPWIAAVLFCLAAALLGAAFALSQSSQRKFQTLSDQVQAAASSLPAGTAEEAVIRPTEVGGTESATQPAPEILPQYQFLAQENPDFFGWITIPDTVIDYPVMYTPEEPEKYLHADFDGAYSYAGVPFLDEDCGLTSDNLIIYGHNMADGTMFHTLLNYQNEAYYEAHPTIYFNTLYEEQEYEILAAFYDRVYYKYEDVFKFYQFITAENQADFDNAISNFKEKAIYDTGVTAEYGDQLITLVTCAYHTENGRFVVVARKK